MKTPFDITLVVEDYGRGPVNHAVAFEVVCEPECIGAAKKELTNRIREYASGSKMKILEYEIGYRAQESFGRKSPRYLEVVAIARGSRANPRL